MQLHIMPIKKFLLLENLPSASAAIISTSVQQCWEQFSLPFVKAEYMDLDYESPRSFSPGQAAQFASFLKTAGNITDLFVCCDAGESRSPAIAAAICRWLGQSDRHIWTNPHYHPNVLCFRLMLEALELEIGDSEIDDLIYLNRSAFRSAVKR